MRAGSTGVCAADMNAGRRLLATRAMWTGMSTTQEVTGNDRLLLHAGPPFADWASVPTPVRNSLALACVYEGWVPSTDAALAWLAAGSVAIEPAQDWGIVVPLAGVVSPSMALHVVTDAAAPDRLAYAVVNEGMTHCLRLGILDPDVPAHHRWLNTTLASWLADRLDSSPIQPLPLIAAALGRGDDCHSRTVAGSALLANQLLANTEAPADIVSFLHGSPAFALNLWMATASLLLRAAEGIPGSSLITRAGGNGVEFGVQVAARPGVWITVPADPPRGTVEAAHAGRSAVGAIGDSALVDILGLGGQSLSHAPAVRDAIAGHLPADALERPAILLPHELHEADGLRTGLAASTVVATGVAPLVLLGMIGSEGHGRLGGGVYIPPLTLFESALS